MIDNESKFENRNKLLFWCLIVEFKNEFCFKKLIKQDKRQIKLKYLVLL